ncbi:LacI family DNA-binding transcriptional regulator [Paenibacillus sp.]|uniref:LacI family DNA-binding transcriptional regulator n=1 Tax=Paenibacillus sp. TaxID=58172 RepID=UPI002D5CB908|nr:LacI family DNA-binding transcriptional regulator [Paenibacillus sp.]HZG57780.1 LacI family DNA-binding transcriptional regulator [Paenibacillus sp.]
MASTINDVAKLAGVSRQTVSRVLNTPNLVKPETLEAVNRAMAMLDYHPNVSARSLVMRTTKAIGLFMPFTTEQVRQNMFFSTLTSALCHYMTQHDFVLQLFTASAGENYSEMFKRLYREKRVGGYIITCPALNIKEIVELTREGVPYVLIGRPAVEMEGVHYVDGDNKQSGYLSAMKAIENGHRHIVFLNAPESMTMAEDLRAGIARAVEESADADVVVREIHTDLTMQSAMKHTVQCLKESAKPTLFLTADDLLAFGVMRAAGGLGYSTPEQLSVISMSASGWEEMSEKPLSRSEHDIASLGTIAAEYLIKTITQGPQEPLREVLPVRYIPGATCADLLATTNQI